MFFFLYISIVLGDRNDYYWQEKSFFFNMTVRERKLLYFKFCKQPASAEMGLERRRREATQIVQRSAHRETFSMSIQDSVIYN